MIKYVLRANIDEDKYNTCVKESCQPLQYGYSWYLDIVAPQWDALILNDYEAVMPLPWKRKYFIKYIYQPFFCQQLGVFAKANSEELTERFIESIPKSFLKVYLQLNSANVLSEKRKNTERINYILPLQNSYEDTYKRFSKGRKHAVGLGIKNRLNVESFSVDELILIAKNHYEFKNFSLNEYNLLKKLIDKLQSINKAILVGIRDSNNALIGGSIFLLDSTRIIYLFSAMTKEGKKKQVASFLLNDVIEKNSASQMILDFEGSMIPGIASFFKSFGATLENYQVIKTTKLPRFL